MPPYEGFDENSLLITQYIKHTHLERTLRVWFNVLAHVQVCPCSCEFPTEFNQNNTRLSQSGDPVCVKKPARLISHEEPQC